ncbi:MAG TPA: hypothetical protein VHW72_03285 [Candidatus Angelobacter sp.]|jgi:hypothetical protein|nr:hypothetical protein [Candidatus Angelobacter sp.]
MNLLLHGVPVAGQYLVDVGELVAVSAVNARSASFMAMAALYGGAEQLCPPIPPRVYQLDSDGELIAVYD